MKVWVRCIFPYYHLGFQMFLMKSVLICTIWCEFISCIIAWWLTVTQKPMLHSERWWQVMQKSSLLSTTSEKDVKRSYHNLRNRGMKCALEGDQWRLSVAEAEYLKEVKDICWSIWFKPLVLAILIWALCLEAITEQWIKYYLYVKYICH